MHYSLFFNGCSYTLGGELEGVSNNIEYRRLKRFSHLVGEHFKTDYINIATSGKSNDWIVEQTINWFEQGNTCDVAVIQFSKKNRHLLYDKRSFEYHIIPRSTEKIADIFYKEIYTDYLGEQNYYKNLFLLNEYIKKIKTKIIFLTLEKNMNSSVSTWGLKCKDIKITSMVETIIPDDRKYYCRNYSKIYEFTKDKKYKLLTGSHPNELGHKLIANYVINEIENAL